MKHSIVCEKMRRGEVILTAKLNFMNPNVAELMGYFGFDCLWICNEHQGIDRSNLENIIRTGRITGTDMLIRTGFGSHTDLIQPLEMGAQGLMIPHIESVEQVKRIVEYAKFAPYGMRGLDCVNGDADQGMYRNPPEYIEFARENTFLVVQIEDEAALEHADEIAAVPGLDMLFVGPLDFSQSIGEPGNVRHPKIFDAIRKVSEACAKHGKYAATPGLGDPVYIKKLVENGVKFIAGFSDYDILATGLKQKLEEYKSMGLFSFRDYKPW